MITVAAQASRRAANAVSAQHRERLERDERGAAGDDDAGEEAVRVVADEPGAQAREEPEDTRSRAGEERRVGVRMVEPSRSAGRARAT